MTIQQRDQSSHCHPTCLCIKNTHIKTNPGQTQVHEIPKRQTEFVLDPKSMEPNFKLSWATKVPGHTLEINVKRSISILQTERSILYLGGFIPHSPSSLWLPSSLKLVSRSRATRPTHHSPYTSTTLLQRLLMASFKRKLQLKHK